MRSGPRQTAPVINRRFIHRESAIVCHVIGNTSPALPSAKGDSVIKELWKTMSRTDDEVNRAAESRDC